MQHDRTGGGGRRGRRLAAVVVSGALTILGGAASVTAVRAQSPSWTIVPSPNTSASERNGLGGVSCKGTTFCMAAGGYYTGTNPVTAHTEMQKWNGTAWSIVPSPDASGSSVTGTYVRSISCLSSKLCMAAGYYTQSGGHPDQTIIEHWNGTSWSVVASPDVSTVSNDLTSVSCVRSTFCVAAGYTISSSFVEQTLIEQWNGTAWNVVTSPDAGVADFLWGVSCKANSTTGTFCMADGYYDLSSGAQLTLILEWNGTAWSVATSPNPTHNVASPADATLWSVSCVTSGFCMAAGDYETSSNVQQMLIEKWNGVTWKFVPTPDTSTAQENGLYGGVSCASKTFCVDASFCCNNVSFAQTLVEEWNGTAWSIVPSPDTSTSEDNLLQASSCTSSTFCMAVGRYTPASNVPQTLIERWS